MIGRGVVSLAMNATPASPIESVVLRVPVGDGDFVFQIAKMQREDAERIGGLATSGQVKPESRAIFSPPLNLAEAIEKLDTRDYRVIDRDSIV